MGIGKMVVLLAVIVDLILTVIHLLDPELDWNHSAWGLFVGLNLFALGVTLIGIFVYLIVEHWNTSPKDLLAQIKNRLS